MNTKHPTKRSYSSLEKFALHLHPKMIDERAVAFNRTFGLGGICALLFVILAITGMILRFSYIPTVEHAYDSITNLNTHTIFGGLLRSLHHLSANLLVITSFLHLLRVYYSQAIFKERAENWIYGLVLMFLVMASSFTGYLLPWDQLAYWAITIFIQIFEYIPLFGHSLANFIRSGETLNSNTLLNFYNLHTGVLPLLFVFFVSVHFWLVRKAGGVALPEEEETQKVPVIPNLVVKEIMVALLLVAGLFLVAVFYSAPLLDQANPNHSPNPSKSPWYFLGAQELLLHVHPAFSAVIIPGYLLLFFITVPYLNYKNLNIGVWFNSPEGKKLVIHSALFSFFFTFGLIYLLDHFLHFDVWLSSFPSWISIGIVPFLLYAIPVGSFLFYGFRRYKVHNTEVIMASTTVIMVSYLTMLLISLLLRGEGMLLIF
ncbi:cytochrome b N-terminal domain-containing protein [uncultured Sunxiuqinia sp.]|uniref:cytochrome b N-terminal domain-containing protein n=1 Tax=uncultured Sunxiuqinia sp. TaxID=1573825 RepID=UPI002AA8B6DC|nr:cytochrome b N-terminal domain-containing protein [uncultured Sunxiuqinia sp.]